MRAKRAQKVCVCDRNRFTQGHCSSVVGRGIFNHHHGFSPSQPIGLFLSLRPGMPGAIRPSWVIEVTNPLKLQQSAPPLNRCLLLQKPSGIHVNGSLPWMHRNAP
eukprot:Skav234364  [mRNA]  locus=scaffold1274:299023:301969:- [translate_table: standard]